MEWRCTVPRYLSESRFETFELRGESLVTPSKGRHRISDFLLYQISDFMTPLLRMCWNGTETFCLRRAGFEDPWSRNWLKTYSFNFTRSCILNTNNHFSPVHQRLKIGRQNTRHCLHKSLPPLPNPPGSAHEVYLEPIISQDHKWKPNLHLQELCKECVSNLNRAKTKCKPDHIDGIELVESNSESAQ